MKAAPLIVVLGWCAYGNALLRVRIRQGAILIDRTRRTW